MPVHDWTRVDAGIFHHFHHAWIEEISRTLNRGLLPQGYYAMAEQIAGGVGPDVVALEFPNNGNSTSLDDVEIRTLNLAVAQPKVTLRVQSLADKYAAKANSLVVRHTSGHNVIAIIEVVSLGNKNSKNGLQSFLRKVDELLRAGIHLLILDLHPPGPRDPQGIHKAIWDEMFDSDFTLPSDMPLTLASYRADQPPEAFLEFTAVGLSLTAMPLFLNLAEYITVPLESSYQAAWDAVPRYWREVIEGTRQH